MKNLLNKLGTIMVCAMIVFMAIGYAKAQDMSSLQNKTPEQRAQFQTNLMKSKLGLDTSQVVKLQAINLKYALKMEPIIKGDDGKLKKYRAVMAIQKDKDAELKKVFTADQYKQYQVFKEELKEKVRDQMNK